jgi:hypothetical protein
MVSNKVFIAVLVIAIVLVSFAFCVALNVGGLGTALSGVGGPLAKGAYNIFAAIPQFALSGGWPTLTAIGVIFVVIVPILAAYTTWHYDIPYKITGATTTNPAGNYTNTMSREPADPETQPKTNTTK